MANTTIKLKKSGTSGNTPSTLEFGELSLNYADGKLYYKNASGVITYISSGATTNSFSTVNSNSSLILATSPLDTLSFVAGNNISISTDAFNKKITISSTASGTTSGGGPFVVSDDIFTGDGSTVAFTLTSTPSDVYSILVNINGVLQLTSSYSVATNVLTFTEAPSPGASIEVKTTNSVGANTITYSTALAQSAYDKANSANSLAQSAYNAANAAGSSAFTQAAFDRANTASANTIIIQGVDLTQNTNITAVNNFAVSAYDTANGANGLAAGAYNQANVTIGVDATQNTQIAGLQGVDLATNSAITIIQGVDLTQNTNIITANNAAWAAFAAGNTNATNITLVNQYAAAAYAQSNVTVGVDATQNTRLDVIEGTNLTQNTRISIIEGVDTAQNTRLSVIEGVDSSQNTRMSIIEGVDTTQNSDISIIQGVNLTQNTRLDGVEGTNLTQNNNITFVNQFVQSAYNTANSKFNSSGGTITGSVSISGNNDLTVTGNLYVTGTQYVTNTQSFVTNDPLLVLGLGNYTSDVVDIGFASHYNDGSNAHTGLIRDYGTKEYYFFKGYTPELDTNNNVDINHPSFVAANVNAFQYKGNLIATTATINGKDWQSVSDTQNTFITIIQGVDVTQNTRLDGIEGINLVQNTNITTANNAAWAAFTKANNALANTSGTIFGGNLNVSGNVAANAVYTNSLFYANGTPYFTGGASVTLSDSVSSNSSTTAATSNAVLIAVSTALAYSIALG
jgi:hypothetical protein